MSYLEKIKAKTPIYQGAKSDKTPSGTFGTPSCSHFRQKKYTETGLPHTNKSDKSHAEGTSGTFDTLSHGRFQQKKSAEMRLHRTDRTDKTPSVSFVSASHTLFQQKNEVPLAAKLRAVGVPIALEINGEVVMWLVSDEDAVRRTDLSPRFTAAEAEALVQFDKRGMLDLIKAKDKLGGTLGFEMDDL